MCGKRIRDKEVLKEEEMDKRRERAVKSSDLTKTVKALLVCCRYRQIYRYTTHQMSN